MDDPKSWDIQNDWVSEKFDEEIVGLRGDGKFLWITLASGKVECRRLKSMASSSA